jgi:hypothetical protein
MARRRTPPELVRAKWELADRLRTIRIELYGERGLAELAGQMDVPIRTWYSYETGVTVPGEILLRFLVLTSVEPRWLLHGRLPKYQTRLDDMDRPIAPRLEVPLEESSANGHEPDGGFSAFQGSSCGKTTAAAQHGSTSATAEILELNRRDLEPLAVTNGSWASVHPRDWRRLEHSYHCIRMVGDAMAPIIAAGAFIAFSELDEDPANLDGKLTVAWVDGVPIVRWLHVCGHYVLLRAENPSSDSKTHLIDLEPNPARPICRVLWVGTAH